MRASSVFMLFVALVRLHLVFLFPLVNNFVFFFSHLFSYLLVAAHVLHHVLLLALLLAEVLRDLFHAARLHSGAALAAAGRGYPLSTGLRGAHGPSTVRQPRVDAITVPVRHACFVRGAAVVRARTAPPGRASASNCTCRREGSWSERYGEESWDLLWEAERAGTDDV